MKKFVSICFLFLMFTVINRVYATNPPVFNSEAEVDAYYDEQSRLNKEKLESDIQKALDKRDSDIATMRAKYDAEKLVVYQNLFGKNFKLEMIEPYLPINNPDPELIYKDIIKSPTIDGIKKIDMAMFANRDLAGKMSLINDRERILAQEKLNRIKTEIAKEENKTPKETTNNNLKNVDNNTGTHSLDNIELPEININKIEIPKPEVETAVKISWYKKLINWFKGK